jgi:hypothetical protein
MAIHNAGHAMTDIVERLREDAATWNANSQTGDMMLEAADEIERLRERRSALAALEKRKAVRVQRHKDRVSVSFADNAENVDVIVTVTFDLAVVNELDDAKIIELARSQII